MALPSTIETPLLSTVWEAITLSRVLTGTAVFFLLLNRKGLPGVWHYRLFKTLFVELLWNRSRSPAPLLDTQGRPRLFSYLVTKCSNPVIECDYNLHKSNSTFFSDLDINRTQLMMAHFKHVLSSSSMPVSSEKNRQKPLMMALGGVSCLFHREIKPLARYEIWSRVAAWDEKWVYVVSYFVKPGVVSRDAAASASDRDPKVDAKAVLASCMARYVFKEGRITVKPQTVLGRCGLLPLRRDEQGSGKEGEKTGKVTDSNGGGSGWGEERFEEERLKGLEIAAKFSGLEVLPLMTGFGEAGVLGRYADF
ncbi:hypothetical protein BJY04DRAFT_141999 [Aspergillus karnatakaensis]|uniref:uncharacterized protein n=1 Tax=Aspergillus karnatakaensis TaxID=1810916 RepID=UPI003CCCEF0C